VAQTIQNKEHFAFELSEKRIVQNKEQFAPELSEKVWASPFFFIFRLLCTQR
jgi:hypothetical protein